MVGSPPGVRALAFFAELGDSGLGVVCLGSLPDYMDQLEGSGKGEDIGYPAIQQLGSDLQHQLLHGGVELEGPVGGAHGD
jgi:hypothetical protein